MTDRSARRGPITRRATTAVALAALAFCPRPAEAQKDYYNTDRNRPVRIEDAYTTERFALEVKLAPLRLQREPGGSYHWGLDPEIGYGILPRTSVEVGFPVAFVDDGDGARTSGLAGIELSAFHNLNTETRGLPALGLRLDALLPAGRLGPDRVVPSVTGIVTRTFRFARFHANGQYTFGDDDDAGSAGHDDSRWLAGLAVDRAFPLSAFLVTASVHAQQPRHDPDTDPEWHAGAGLRYQLNPYLTLDAGIGRRLSGAAGWYATFGTSYHVGIRSLMPGRRPESETERLEIRE
ncbi:MAG TPA: transporter [Longimicrobiales bacterium]|nr:transporter [Longimicrobiales bacterium]